MSYKYITIVLPTTGPICSRSSIIDDLFVSMNNVAGELADHVWPEVQETVSIITEEYLADELSMGEVTEVPHVQYKK